MTPQETTKIDCAVFLRVADPKLIAEAMRRLKIKEYRSPHDIFAVCALVLEAAKREREEVSNYVFNRPYNPPTT